MTPTWILAMHSLWPQPKKYDLESKLWYSLLSSTTNVWNIIQIQRGSKEFVKGIHFVCVHCDINLIDLLP